MKHGIAKALTADRDFPQAGCSPVPGTTDRLISSQGKPTPVAGIRRWPSEDAHAWTRAFLSDANDNASILAVVAYGSAVREVESSADLDLLFVFEGDAPTLDPPPADVDLRGYARNDVEALLAEGHDVLGWALRFGIVLWQRDG